MSDEFDWVNGRKIQPRMADITLSAASDWTKSSTAVNPNHAGQTDLADHPPLVGMGDGGEHRQDGPTHIGEKGQQEWRVNGRLHRLDGPAVIWPNGGRNGMWAENSTGWMARLAFGRMAGMNGMLMENATVKMARLTLGRMGRPNGGLTTDGIG